MVWNAISIKFIVIVVRSSASASKRGGAGTGAGANVACKWQWNGNCINGVVCLIMQALCCAVSEQEGAECDWAHSCWSIAKSIVIINTHAHAHTHTRALAQQAKQIGGYYCHYNVYYCYPFNTKWPLLTGAILTFKCRRHCSKLTVRGQTATRLAASQGAAADPVNVQLWRRAIKISARETANKTRLGNAMQNIWLGCEIFGIHIN